jgi:hypothetical protein
VTLRPETAGDADERLDIAWRFTVGDERVTAVSVHADLTSALAAAGIRSARAPDVDRRVFGWGVLAHATVRSGLASLLDGFARRPVPASPR